MNYYMPDVTKLQALASENKKRYAEGDPFPHIYLDNVFPEEALNSVLEEFPGANDVNWHRFRNAQEMKLALKDESNYGAFTRHFINSLNSRPFLKFLEELTGIGGLIPDPYLEGGGLHQIVRGGLLKIHADFNKHPITNLDRRLNVLIYLNKDWDESYGGHFELWDRSMEKAEVKILPLFNRMAVFSTTSYSYHGHPDALNCPEDRTRKSIALYYYTNGRPEEEIDPALGSHTTLFKIRRDKKEDFKKGIRLGWKDFVPPVITHVYNRLIS
ncbi:2OG-Fe(II) oxygenase [Chitinophaga sp. CF418]|uniref:2OG-Fe(II) oxygenase n=1 Tax=Chitinophaga sp. CF418 TaxID=1855287 RepID=UPI000923A42F|nr:2OG-Fe(II) oxygenase [Chitinophaga sp. CF418]SHN42491.1 2OG-Fe(II) oxygenase superfamily protein [Chitinophaga sp. CF418]